MTDTNAPDAEILREIADQLEAAHNDQTIAGRLSISNTRALTGVRDSFVTFITPLGRLQSSISRMDETNRKITQMGTTYTKLRTSLEKNSNVMAQNNVSNRALIGELAKNMEQGVRINNGALTDLTKEMIATGQNVALQRTMNANAVLQTGNNTAAVQQINKTNREVSDKYGISNDRLIESLNSLKSTVDSVSIFGPQAVTAFSDITQKIQGRVGGADVKAATQTVLEILTPGTEKLAASLLLGAGGSRGRTAEGAAPSMGDVNALLRKIKDISDSTEGRFKAEIAAAKAGLSKQQFIQLKNLGALMESDFKLNQEVQVTEKEKYNNLKNLQDKQNDWYDYGANVMLTLLGKMSTSLVLLGMKLPQIGGATGTAMQMLGGPRSTSGPRNVRAAGSAMNIAVGATAAAGLASMGQGNRSGGPTAPMPVLGPAPDPNDKKYKQHTTESARLAGVRPGTWTTAAHQQAAYQTDVEKHRSATWRHGGGADRDLRNKRLGRLGYDPLPAGTDSQRRLAERRAARPKSMGKRITGGLKSGMGGGLGVGLAAGAIGQMTGVDTTGTSTGAMIGSMIPGIGTAIGTGVGLLYDISKYAFASSEADKERVKQEREKKDEERADAISRDERRLNFITGMLRSRSVEDPVDAAQWEALVAFAKKTAENTEPKPGVSAKR